ncbi:hypothetical protein ON010_g13176 [Phytophthora cinnamomi]|nr:hypothetical protein ON010_g13176 [Phytophthora cinnamomi]
MAKVSRTSKRMASSSPEFVSVSTPGGSKQMTLAPFHATASQTGTKHKKRKADPTHDPDSNSTGTSTPSTTPAPTLAPQLGARRRRLLGGRPLVRPAAGAAPGAGWAHAPRAGAGVAALRRPPRAGPSELCHAGGDADRHGGALHRAGGRGRGLSGLPRAGGEARALRAGRRRGRSGGCPVHGGQVRAAIWCRVPLAAPGRTRRVRGPRGPAAAVPAAQGAGASRV